MASDSDDELTLASSTLDALKAFYAERDEEVRRLAELQAAADAAAELAAAEAAEAAAAKKAAALAAALSMTTFPEDWNESQFWYDNETAGLYARQLLDGADASSLVAVISTPSVFIALKNIVNSLPEENRPRLILLEHDHRFAVFGDEFVYYDFNAPIKLPAALRGAADRIICDPPFLSDDCQTKAALTARWLGRPNTPVRLIVSTGERMGELITTKIYKAQGVRTTTYEPQHARGLSNEFFCYANFECDDWKWRPSA